MRGKVLAFFLPGMDEIAMRRLQGLLRQLDQVIEPAKASATALNSLLKAIEEVASESRDCEASSDESRVFASLSRDLEAETRGILFEASRMPASKKALEVFRKLAGTLLERQVLPEFEIVSAEGAAARAMQNSDTLFVVLTGDEKEISHLQGSCEACDVRFMSHGWTVFPVTEKLRRLPRNKRRAVGM